MKNIEKIILLTFLVFFNCKENSKEVLIQPKSHIEGLNKNLNIEKDTSFLISEIINKKLIPLILIDKDEKELSKKYQIDFYAVCMCDSQSMHINEKDSVFTVFDYCYGDMPNNREISSKHSIKKIEKTKDQIKIHLNTPEKELYIQINKTGDEKIYEVKIIGSYSFYNRLKDYRYFSFLSDQTLFSKEDCGDFDG